MHSLNILSKVQINQVQDVSQKVTLHGHNSLTKFSYKSDGGLEIVPDSLMHIVNGVISKPPVLEQMHLHMVDCICTVNSEYANDSFMLPFEERVIHHL